MNTARIVVLAIAAGAGLTALYHASEIDNRPASTEPVAQLPTADILVAQSDIGLSPEPRIFADINMVGSRTDDQSSKRGESVNVVRCDVASPQTMQKQKGCTI